MTRLRGRGPKAAKIGRPVRREPIQVPAPPPRVPAPTEPSPLPAPTPARQPA